MCGYAGSPRKKALRVGIVRLPAWWQHEKNFLKKHPASFALEDKAYYLLCEQHALAFRVTKAIEDKLEFSFAELFEIVAISRAERSLET